jgi:lipopolysaccharide transport system ATP-binding protein
MSNTAISVENLSKSYRLGQIGTGTLNDDLKVWWAKTRGKPNPLLKIGQVEHHNQDGEIFWALKDINFTVNQGEVLGIIGRNGAGKSTLLKILSRVTAPTCGCVKVKGRIASLLEVGTGFHPDLTGRENIYLNGAILGMTKEEISRKFDEIVNFAEIEQFIDTPVKRYSSGMYVRLAFAVAAHLDPEILVVDEVLAVGDAEFQKKSLGKMGDVAHEGRTVLFVSHNMRSVETLCHNGLLIDSGHIAYQGKIAETIHNYSDSFLQTNTIKDIRDIRNRSGNQNIVFTHMSMANTQSQEKEFISSGEEFELCFSYSSNIQVEPSSVNFEVRCFDRQNNNLIFMHSMRYSGFKSDFEILPSSGKTTLRIKNLLLKPGNYRIMAIIKVYEQTTDSIEDALNLEVYEPQSNKTGLSYSNFPVTILVDGSWNLEPD